MNGHIETAPSVVVEPWAHRVRWSAIFAGAVVALGVWALLYVFGLAAGLSAMDPNDPGSARSAGIGTGIWSMIVPLIALFVGGFIAARLAGEVNRGVGALHGAVLWGLTTLAGIALVGSLVGSLVGGLAKTGAQGVAAVAGGASNAESVTGTLGLDANDLLGPVNQRLQAQGAPPVRADQLQAVLRDVAGQAVRGGSLDLQTVVTSVTQHTALSRADAEQLAGDIEQRFNQAKSTGLQKAQQGALKAADATGKVMWGAFGALLLGLVSAVAGGMVGAPVHGHRPVEPRRTIPVGPPREVHP